jgi:hypothetical protein
MPIGKPLACRADKENACTPFSILFLKPQTAFLLLRSASCVGSGNGVAF